jgi:AbrB family looped-hinge helix DNA binding protein
VLVSTVRVYHDGWIAIPESVRKRLQIESGDLLWVSVDRQRLILSPSPQLAESTPEPAREATASRREADTKPARQTGDGPDEQRRRSRLRVVAREGEARAVGGRKAAGKPGRSWSA